MKRIQDIRDRDARTLAHGIAVIRRVVAEMTVGVMQVSRGDWTLVQRATDDPTAFAVRLVQTDPETGEPEEMATEWPWTEVQVITGAELPAFVARTPDDEEYLDTAADLEAWWELQLPALIEMMLDRYDEME
jgi:hypothetical protein